MVNDALTMAARSRTTSSGTEEELGELSDVVAAWAEDERSPSRRRRWRQLAQSLEPRRGSWLEQNTDVMADALDALGLTPPGQSSPR